MNTRDWAPHRVQSWIDRRIGALPSRHRRRSRPAVSTGRQNLVRRVLDYYLHLDEQDVPRSAMGWWMRLRAANPMPDEPTPFYASWLDSASERRQRAVAQADGVPSELGTGALYGVGWRRR